MDTKQLFEWLGLDPPSMVAGFWGGILNIFMLHKINPFDAGGAILFGIFTANYVGKPIADAIHFPVITTSFVIGLGGVTMAEPIIRAVRTRIWPEKMEDSK